MPNIFLTPHGRLLDLKTGAIISMSDIMAAVQDAADSNLQRLVSSMFKRPKAIGAIFDVYLSSLQTTFKLTLTGSSPSDYRILVSPGSGLTDSFQFISLTNTMILESDGANGLQYLLSQCQSQNIPEVDIYIQNVRKYISSSNGGLEVNLKNGIAVTAGSDAGKLTIDQVGADSRHLGGPGAPIFTSKNCYWFKMGSVEYPSANSQESCLFQLYPVSALDATNVPSEATPGNIIRIGGLKYETGIWKVWMSSPGPSALGPCLLVQKNFS